VHLACPADTRLGWDNIAHKTLRLGELSDAKAFRRAG
jgi:hypothetical protein